MSASSISAPINSPVNENANRALLLRGRIKKLRWLGLDQDAEEIVVDIRPASSAFRAHLALETPDTD